MQLNFLYSNEVEKFIQIVLLSSILTVPVSVLTQECKRHLNFSHKYIYWILNILLSTGFSIFFCATFARKTIGIQLSFWVAIMVYLGTTGFYSKMKKSNGTFGKYFQTKLEIMEKMNEVPIKPEPKPDEDKEMEIAALKEAIMMERAQYQQKIEDLQKQIENSTCKTENPPKPAESVPEEKEPEKKPVIKDEPKLPDFKKSQKVYYNGTTVYKSPTDTKSAGTPNKGYAVVTHLTAEGAHRVHLEPYKGGSGVYGWVNEKDILLKMPPTAKPKSVKFTFPVKYIGISVGFSSKHRGVDFGWHSKQGGPHVPIYSAMPGYVYSITQGGGAGNCVTVRYDDKVNRISWYSKYKHLQTISVKKGQTVKQTTRIGKMGDTGNSNGSHLHFDLVKCPLGHNYNQERSGERARYSVNPLYYLYLTKNNIVGNETIKKWNFKRM